MFLGRCDAVIWNSHPEYGAVVKMCLYMWSIEYLSCVLVNEIFFLLLQVWKLFFAVYLTSASAWELKLRFLSTTRPSTLCSATLSTAILPMRSWRVSIGCNVYCILQQRINMHTAHKTAAESGRQMHKTETSIKNATRRKHLLKVLDKCTTTQKTLVDIVEGSPIVRREFQRKETKMNKLLERKASKLPTNINVKVLSLI